MSRTYLTLILALMASVVLSACEEETTRPVVPPELEGMEGVVQYGFEAIITRRGVREAVATADAAYTFEDSTVVHMEGDVRLVSYDPDTGRELAEVTSDWGRLNLSSNAMIARRNAVLVIREDERRIESAELHYAPDRNLIWSDSASTMYTDDRIIEGSGFESDLQFQRPTIRNARTRRR
ncbi:MAG: LPS export ABC transporter periplasmic protein LptC [Halobacteriales archaeon]|nr:LPS export ABC transporter periplasmic protein LptC [Halobacteriales archaeon]